MLLQLFLEAPLLSVPTLALLHILVVCAVLLHPCMQTATSDNCQKKSKYALALGPKLDTR